MTKTKMPEPWLRGTLPTLSPVIRAVLHALELAGEDLERWCGRLTDDQLNARPFGLAPVAFHFRHIARSLDRLLTYAEGRQLNATQLAALQTELEPASTRDALFEELTKALQNAGVRTAKFNPQVFDEARSVGRQGLATTIGGLLVHVADHTQRHVGQAITTAKIVAAVTRPDH